MWTVQVRSQTWQLSREIVLICMHYACLCSCVECTIFKCECAIPPDMHAGVPLLVVLLSVALGHDYYLIIDKANDTVIA